MADLTTNPDDPRLGHGVDKEITKQHDAYLVLSDEEKARGFIRPIRTKYIHKVCGVETRMSESIAETYARDPKFYGATYCVGCQKHLPVSEFLWSDTTEEVGS